MSSRVQELERRVQKLQAKKESVEERIAQVTDELSNLRNNIEDLEKIHGVITQYAQVYQENFLRQIEEVVTKGLQAIFEEPMSFRIEQVVSGKRLEVKFFLTTGEGAQALETGIMDARGGGVGAVVGFLLRVAILLLVDNGRKLLVLDETFAQLSAEYLPNLGEFIKQLVENTPLQVVMVTHQAELTESAGVVYRVSQQHGETKITREV